MRGIECFAGEAFPNNGLESNVCLNKLKHLIRKDLKQILVAVKALVGLMSENPVDLSAIENYDPGKICPGMYILCKVPKFLDARQLCCNLPKVQT